MSTLNKALLACLLVVFVLAAIATLHFQGGKSPDRETAVDTPDSTTSVSQSPALTVQTAIHRTPAPTPPPRTPHPTPALAPGATPLDETALVAQIRADVDSGDAAKRDAAENLLANLLTEGKGVTVLKEWIVSDRKDLQDDVLSLLPNLNEDARLPLLNLALDAKDEDFRTNMLTQVRDVISSDPEKEALNDLLIKAMKDSDTNVLEEAADLFMYFGDAENDGPLYRAASTGLVSENETIREAAMSYLEDNHTLQSILALTEALQSQYPDMVEKAGDALRFITDAEIESNKFAEWAKWCREHGEAWAKENDRTVP